MKFQENVLLSHFSNYKIGGIARFFFEPKNEKEVVWAIGEARAAKLSIFILGGGTNLLISDGFSGLVIKPAIDSIETVKDGIEVGSGVLMSKLLDYASVKSLSGLEWAGGLPGTLGGAIRGNAGCFGGEIKDVVRSVRSFNVETMKVVERTADECVFGYRDSIFKKSENKKGVSTHGAIGTSGAAGEIILSATLALKKGDKKEIVAAIKEKIEHRVKNHPLEYPNIGSIFKNVPLTQVHAAKTKQYAAALEAGTVKFAGSQFSVKTDPFPVISSAKLISEAGLRGVSFGGAMISGKHPNFIVNVLNAGPEDVMNLIALAKQEVKRKFGVELEEEVQIV